MDVDEEEESGPPNADSRLLDVFILGVTPGCPEGVGRGSTRAALPGLLGCVDTHSLTRCSRLCRRARELVGVEHVWEPRVRRHLPRRVHVHPPHPTGGLHGGQAHEQDLPLGRVPQIHQVVAARSTKRDPVRLRAARCLPLRSCCGVVGRPGAPGAGGGRGVGAACARASQHHLSVEVACGCWHVGAGGISHPDPRDIWSGHAVLGVGSEKWELQRIFRSP
mmetsp:Transcript_92157/g.298087  ORF Transcript_92157/g.298087 Transcript_92157/m.298087 type:complete len:221 (-) Transcript_92157:165-827(-)